MLVNENYFLCLYNNGLKNTWLICKKFIAFNICILKNIISHLVWVLLAFLLFSCQQRESNEPSTFTVYRSDFEDVLPIDGLVEAVQTTTIYCPGDVDATVISIIDNGVMVSAGDTICVLEDKSINTNYENAQKNLDVALAKRVTVKADLELQYSMMAAQVKSNETDAEIAKSDSLQLLLASPTQRRIKELEMKQVVFQRQKLQKKLKTLAKINQVQNRQLDMVVQRYTVEVQNWKNKLFALKLVTNQSGLATRGTSWMTGKKVAVGDNVWNGMPLVIIPEQTKMKVIINASEGNYKRISVDNPVEYSFDAMPNNKAWGKILKKAPVGKQIKQDSKVKLFEIEASVDSSLTIPKIDLSASCRIILNRVEDTIVVPQIAIFDKDKIKVVYVRSAKGYEMRQITLGTTSTKDAIVSAGLRAKETIALSEPVSTLIIGKKLLPKPKPKSAVKPTNKLTSSVKH